MSRFDSLRETVEIRRKSAGSPFETPPHARVAQPTRAIQHRVVHLLSLTAACFVRHRVRVCGAVGVRSLSLYFSEFSE